MRSLSASLLFNAQHIISEGRPTPATGKKNFNKKRPEQICLVRAQQHLRKLYILKALIHQLKHRTTSELIQLLVKG